jgi:hypothetical protein
LEEISVHSKTAARASARTSDFKPFGAALTKITTRQEDMSGETCSS